jgi:hypothetical protein
MQWLVLNVFFSCTETVDVLTASVLDVFAMQTVRATFSLCPNVFRTENVARRKESRQDTNLLRGFLVTPLETERIQDVIPSS